MRLRAPLLTWAMCGLAACSGHDSPSGPPVTALITVDTWRSSHFSATHTPALFTLSEEGERFESAWSPIGLTSPAHATMLTGLQPWEHGMEANNHHGFVLPASVPRVTADHTFDGQPKGAFVSAYPAGPEGGLGIGFDVFDGPEAGERPGSETVARALAWLPANTPAFLWVHVYEPHGPYEGQGQNDVDRYAEEVRKADALLVPLLEQLVARGSTIVVAADHGEVLLEERCGRQHERSVSDHVLHVPLFRWTPDRPGVQRKGLVGLEVVPTLLTGGDPTPKAAHLAEAGMCEPGCSPGCRPEGLAGRDRLAITAEGGRALLRGGAVKVRGAVDPATIAALGALPAVPEPGEPNVESLRQLGYTEP